jgi:hypothetical protein
MFAGQARFWSCTLIAVDVALFGAATHGLPRAEQNELAPTKAGLAASEAIQRLGRGLNPDAAVVAERQRKQPWIRMRLRD